jgi:hypothetical protein
VKDSALSREELRGFVGQHVRHLGTLWLVVDVLEDGPSLVLRDCDSHLALQNDQFGDPHRLVPRVVVLPVWDAERRQLTADFLRLDISGV